MKKYNKLFAILFAVLGVTTLKAQTEIISNGNNLNKQHNFGSVSSHTIPELWCDDARQGFNFSQAVELPNGVYTLSFQMMYRASLTAGTSTNCVLYAETSGEVYNESIKNFADVAGTAENLTGVTNAMNNSADNYKSTIPYFIVTDGRSTVGARSLGALTRCTNGYWLIWNPASFKLVSVTDNATLTQALNDLKAEAKAILDAAPDSDAKATLQAAYNNAVATSDGLVALKQAIKAYLPGTGTAANPVDVSSLILSADFSQKAFIVATKNNNGGVSLPELQPVGWTCTDTGNGQYNFFNVVANNATYDGQSNFAYNGKTTGQSLYMRHAWGKADLVAKQTVKLPNGRYKISVPAKKTANTATVKYTFAGTTETHNVTTSWAVYEKTFTVNDANNELTIELTYSHPSGGGQRAFFDGVTLLCYGDPIKALLEEISTKTDELREYKTQIPQKAYASYNEHLTAAGNVNNSMEESALQTILDNLNADIAAAEPLVSPYVNLKSLITTCERYLDNSIEFKDGAAETFSTAVGSAKTDVEAATTADAINTVYNTLEKARQTYVKQADPTNGIGFDYTFLVVNPGFDNGKTGWESTGGAQNKAIATNKTNGIITGAFFENWNPSNFTGEIYQTISNLPSGIYKLKVAAFGANTNVYANDKQTAVTTGDGAWYEVDEVTVGDGTLKFGIKNENATTWMGIDNASLEYYGFDVATAQSAITSMVTEAEGLVGKPMNAGVASALQAAIDGADATKTTRNELNSMIETLSKAIADAEASIAAYVNIKKYIDHAKDFDTAGVLPYENRYNNGEFTTAGEETIRQELNVMTANYVAENFKNEIGLTNWGAESDAMWSTQGEHWDGTATTTYYDANGTNTTHTLAKTVELTPGTYVFRAAGRSNTNTTLSLSIDIDGIEPAVFHAKGNTGYGIATDGTATFNESASYARDGQGQGWEWQFIKFTLTEESTVTLTATCQTNGWGWASFGNNGLWMDDATYVIANAGALTTPLASAKELVEKPMGNNEKDALTSAITQAEGEITTPKQLDAAVEALNKAINEAKPSIETYATIKTYIDKADKIDASIAAGYKSQYDNGSITETATNVFQALEVATYNYVTENFNYAVPISSTWNSTGTNTSAKEFNNEHWSGETRGYMNQNDDNGQGWNASAWSLDFDQDVTLPAGEYVFKVAGRKSVDATLELVVTMGETTLGTVADFPNGSTGRGINKAGAASFDPEDPKGFTRDDRTGFGWQWRYVKFELKEGATVKIAVHAETSKHGNWVSFGDYTLQMTEETYLEANKGALDAPTAAAEALVDTKPMGAAENTALNDALAMPVNTGAELLAKIEALKTAVANANAWVAAYNEAKEPLVAAFERFESDYNDGANGCLLPITDEAWQELLEAVKSAALAKDAYNDYSGFEQAAKNFNEAMDNATYKGFSMSNQLECTNIILNADCQANDAWAGNGRSVLTGQHWSGDASRVYFAQNHENGAARNQTVTMPYKGWYILKVSVRAVVANSYVDIQIDGASNKLQGAHGREGGTIATDGTEWENIAAGIAAGKKFANDNKGYGWIYKYIAFNVENANTEVKIGIALSNKDQNGKEANVGGMELYYVGSNAYVMAGNVVKHYGEYTETIATTHTTHDVTNATMSDPDVNVTANPNALIIANEGQVSNENNVVVNGTASSLVLTEGYTFNATTNFTATALNYAREFSANWLTVCLPFAYEIPENVKVETLSAVDLDTKTFTFEEVNETMEANKPYIIKNSSETAALFAELGDVAVEATPEAMTVEVTAEGSEHKAEFIGTYTALKTNALMEITEDVAKYDILFFGNDGQLYYLSNGVTTKVVNIKPFRAYIRLPKGAINWSDGQQAIARHGKRTTSIDNAELATDNAPVIYDLMGRKVIQMQKGHMYIVNGKKVVIK